MSIKREDVGTRYASGATGGRKGEINTEFTLKPSELTFSISFNSCALVTQHSKNSSNTKIQVSGQREKFPAF